MRQIEKHGKTVEEAKEAALKELGAASDDDVEFEVLDEGSKGVFGWGTKFARVKATLKRDVEPEVPAEPVTPPATVPAPPPAAYPAPAPPRGERLPAAEPLPELEEIINTILRHMGLSGTVEQAPRDNETQIRYNIVGENLGVLIGKHGQTLEALQFIVNLIFNRLSDDRSRVVIDVEGYRERREKSLVDMACRLADKVKRDQKNIVLKPMMPNERRIIHMALQNDPHISTFSQGEEPLRKVIIAPRRLSSARSGEVHAP